MRGTVFSDTMLFLLFDKHISEYISEIDTLPSTIMLLVSNEYC